MENMQNTCMDICRSLPVWSLITFHAMPCKLHIWYCVILLHHLIMKESGQCR